MSALFFPGLLRQGRTISPILHGSRYELDSEYSLHLLAVTCSEQEGRLHTLNLLSEYLASGAGGRKRQLVAKEVQALRELYEAVWCELGCAFNDPVIRSAREAVEQETYCRESLGLQEGKHHDEQQSLF